MQDAIATHGEVFKILLESPPMPNSGIAVHPSIPASVQQQIRSALLLLPPELFSGITADGFVVKPEGFYDIIRDLEEENSTQEIAQ